MPLPQTALHNYAVIRGEQCLTSTASRVLSCKSAIPWATTIGEAILLGLALMEGSLQLDDVLAQVQALLLHLLRLMHHGLQVALQLSRVALQACQLSVACRDRHRNCLGHGICPTLHAQQLRMQQVLPMLPQSAGSTI